MVDHTLEIRNRYSALFDYSLDFLILHDHGGMILDLNKISTKLLGYSRKEIIGHTLSDFLVHSDRQKYSSFIDEYKEKGTITKFLHLSLKDKEGKLIPMKYNVIPLETHGDLKVFLGIGHNISPSSEIFKESPEGGIGSSLNEKGEEKVKRLSSREAELENILSESPAVVFLWKNAEGWPVEFVSDNVRQFGYEPEDFYSQKYFYEDVIHLEDRERIKAEILQYSQQEVKEFTQEYRIYAKDGIIRWVEDHTWIRRNEEGLITHYQGIILDISERKLIHQNLKESEEKFRSVAEQSIMGIFISQDNEFKYVNQKFTDITGYSIEELMNWNKKDIARLIHPDNRDYVLEQWTKKQRGDEDVVKNYQFRGVKKNGDIFWADMYSHTIVYNGKPADLGIFIDITGRKSTEDRLKESELTFNSLAENIHDGLTIIENNNIIFLNDRIVEITGYSREELKGMTEFDLVVPEDKKKLEGSYDKVWKSNTARKELGFWILTKGGQYCFITNRYTHLKKDEDTVITFILTTDTTERKISEKLLKESEEKYRDLFENAPFSIILYDLRGNVVDANSSTVKKFRYERQELIGKHFTQFSTFSKDLLPEVRTRFKRLLQGERLEPSEFNIVTKEGKKLIVLSQISRVKLGGKDYLQGFIQDITATKEAEQKLKESEEMFRNIAEQSFMGISIIQDNIIKYANQALLDIFGYIFEEIKNWKPLEYLNLFPPGDKEFVQNQERIKQLNYDMSIHDYIIRFIRKSGTLGWANLYSKGIEYQKRPAALVIFIDISDRKEAEEKLKESEKNFKRMAENIQDGLMMIENDSVVFVNKKICQITEYSAEELELMDLSDFVASDGKKRIMEATSEFIIDNDASFKELEYWIKTKNGNRRYINNRYTKLTKNDGSQLIFILTTDMTERKNTEKLLKESELKYRNAYERENFYKDLFAHDMNNILQGILIALELSLLQLPDSDKSLEPKEMLREMKRQVDRGTSLINNVTKFSELDESEKKLEPINVSKTLKEAITIIKKGYFEKEIKIQLDLESEDLPVLADDFLIDVFENILINSIKHNDNSEIQIEIKASFILQLGSKAIKIEFADNGNGIPDAKKQSIFIRGVKEDRSVSGLGLGLSLVKKILDIYGATISVENKVPQDHTQGTKFIIIFPEVEKSG